MANFEERSSVVCVQTTWGHWFQTVDEVFVIINVKPGTPSREIKCDIRLKHLKVEVSGEVLINGDFPATVRADECIWTLEDKKTINVCLLKSLCGADKCWRSLLQGQYEADPYTFDQMQKKLTLQRFQYEHPGFDFSGAGMSGGYQDGGPQLNSS